MFDETSYQPVDQFTSTPYGNSAFAGQGFNTIHWEMPASMDERDRVNTTIMQERAKDLITKTTFSAKQSRLGLGE